MLDKINYISKQTEGLAGQDARSKEWFCKEVPFKDAKELKEKIIELNKVFNEVNKQIKKDDQKKLVTKK